MSAHHNEAFLRLAREAKARIREVSPELALDMKREGALLLDVREGEEFAAGHLSGATHLSRGLLEMKIADLAPETDRPIVCYCAGGNRGALAADTLGRMGYTRVVSIEGGLSACQAWPNPTHESS